MAEPRRLERLSGQDLLMLWADDFGWSEDIGVLGVLDGTRLLDRDGRVRVEEVRRRLAPRLALVPRFRQLLYRPRWGLGRPLWVDAASFDLADHVLVQPLDPPGGQAELQAACARLGRRRLDPSRPLWELWLLPGLPDHRVGLFVRVHHTIADGVAGVAAFAALLDPTPDAPLDAGPDPDRGRAAGGQPAPAPAGTGTRADAPGPSEREPARRRQGVARAPRRAAPRTSLNRPIGSDRRLAVVSGRLEVTRQVAHAHQAKVNDVALAAVAGGLRRLLAGRGEDPDGLVLRVMVPVSLHRERPGQAAGNQGSVMLVPLPVGEPDPVRRLELIAAETAVRKRDLRPQMGGGLMGLAAVQRAWYRALARQRTVNLSVTNVPGPPAPLYLAGTRLLELSPVVSLMGNLTLAVAVLSYAGQLTLTAVADRDTCPDVEVFARGVREALDDLARSAPVPS
jgi:diacylglycerol O-acyltransferase / wax synthase